MAVGVPETAVFEAADAVLARGERPTVERVRLELGRGSPARVGALLDQWWEQLASRLRGETRMPGLPAEVAQAFTAVWQQATVQAQAVVELSVTAQRQVLMEERELLAEREEQGRQEAARIRQQGAEAAAARQAAETRLADLATLLEQRMTQIDDLRRQRDELSSQRDEARTETAGLREQLHAVRSQAEQARIDQERYTRDVEDRAFREIDRAREESKSLALQVKDGAERLQHANKAVRDAQAALGKAQEEGAHARLQLLALQEQAARFQQAETNLLAIKEELQQRLALNGTELAAAREHAAAATARAQTLAQQLTLLSGKSSTPRTRRPPKSATDKAQPQE